MSATYIPSFVFDPPKITIYADGSGPNYHDTKRGGAAFLILEGNEVLLKGSRALNVPENDSHSTELMAIRDALVMAHFSNLDHREVTLYTDSRHSLGLIRGRMLSVKYCELLLEIKELIRFFSNLQLEWIKGHSGNANHNLVDKMARIAREKNIQVWSEKF